jgi:hypothetical protein
LIALLIEIDQPDEFRQLSVTALNVADSVGGHGMK